MDNINVQPNSNTNTEEQILTISEKSNDGQITITSPDNLFDRSNIYQINCQLTIIITKELQNLACHKIITTVCVNNQLIENNKGYKIDSITSDTNFDDYIKDKDIEFLINNGKFHINISTTIQCNIFACATIKMTSFNIAQFN